MKATIISITYRLVAKLATWPTIYNFMRNFLEDNFNTQRQLIRREITIKKGEKVLDIGSGTGTYSPLFNSCEYIGFDIVEDYINWANLKYVDKTFLVADATKMPFKEGTFHWAIIAHCFHHWSDSTVERVLKGLKRILVEKGKLLVLDQREAPVSEFAALILQKLDLGKYIRTRKAYSALFSPHFEIIRQYEVRSRFYPIEVYLLEQNEQGSYERDMDCGEPELSAVLLCYKANKMVKKIVKDLEDSLAVEGIDYEIILVGNHDPDDNSDETPFIVRDLANRNPRIKCSAEAKQGMMGWDMRSGLAMATGKYIAVTDGDGQMPMSDVVRVYKRIRSNNYDLVKTYRIIRGDSTKRRAISRIYNMVFNVLFPGVKIRDVNSKPKIFSRKTYESLSLKSNDWSIDAEIMIKARKLRFLIEEIPTIFFKLEERNSFVKLNTIFEFIINLSAFRIKDFFSKDE